jgi:hypothetical protein
VVFIILGIGLWIIKPSWVLQRDLTGLPILPLSIDWLKLVVWDLVITIILVLIAWLIRVLSESYYYF